MKPAPQSSLAIATIELWDDWRPEKQTAFDVIAQADDSADVGPAIAGLNARNNGTGLEQVTDDGVDEWKPLVQKGGTLVGGEDSVDDDADSDDDWVPEIQGAANVDDSQQAALEKILKPSHLIEREQKLPFETKQEADSAGRMLHDMKRPPTLQEAKEEVRYGADVEQLPKAAYRVMTEDEAIIMVERGANVGFRGQHGHSPLHVAAEFAYPRLCKALCDAKGDLEARDKFGETPLLSIAKAGTSDANIPNERRQETMKMLLRLGADIHAVNPRGRGVLHLAAAESDSVALETLIEGMADVNMQDVAGFTPIIWAAGRNGVKSVRMLLDADADANHKGKRGQTAMTFALTNSNNAVVEVLEKYKMLHDHEQSVKTMEPENQENQEQVLNSVAPPRDGPTRPDWACKIERPTKIEPYVGRVYMHAKPSKHSTVYT